MKRTSTTILHSFIKTRSMLSSTFVLCLFGLGLSQHATGQCNMGFTGEFDPANWTIITNTLGFSFDVNLAEVNFTPSEMKVRALDTGGFDGSDLDFPLNAGAEIAMPADGILSFDYAYNGADPFFDWYSITIDGVSLAANNMFAESGNINIPVTAGQVLLIGIDDDGCCSFLSPSELLITNFSLTSDYVGNVLFTSQAQVDAWSSCINTINGSVMIQGAGIFDLSPLMNVETITGNLTIQYGMMSNLNGLQGLQTVGGSLIMNFNLMLSSLFGLENLTTVGGSYFMFYNFLLSDCCAINDLLTNGSVGGVTSILFNAAGSHCNSPTAIMSACAVTPLAGHTPNNTMQSNLDIKAPEKATDLELFPNPAEQIVHVVFDRMAPTAHLKIMDMLGRAVYEEEVSEDIGRVTIDLNSGRFIKGIYIVSLIEAGEIRTKQLIIQ